MPQPPSEPSRQGPAWLYAEPALSAFGQRVALPSLRSAVVGLCLVVTLLQVYQAAGAASVRRRPEFFGAPVRPVFATRFGLPPPAFTAARADGSSVGVEALPRQGLALVCFLTERCGACEFMLAHMDELRRDEPDVRIVTVLTSGGHLDQPAARAWCERHGVLEEALFDQDGAWGRSWIGQQPSLPYCALVVDGALVWGEVGTGEANSLRAIVESWRTAQASRAGAVAPLLGGLEVTCDGGPGRLGELTRTGVWVVNYGARANPGVQQRRAALSACRGPDGAPIPRVEVVTDRLPPPAEDRAEVWGDAMVVATKGGLLAAPPVEWMPYTEVLLDGEVVYAETREAATRDVVIQVVCAARSQAVR